MGLLRTVVRRDPRWVLLAVNALVATVAGLLLPVALAGAVDGALSGGAPVAALALLVGLTAVELLGDAVGVVLAASLTARATAWLRNSVARRLVDLGHPTPFAAGDAVSRLTGDAAIAGGTAVLLVGLGVSVATAVGAVTALALLDWRLAVVFLVSVPVGLRLVRSHLRLTERDVTAYQRVSGELSARLLDAVVGLRTIAAAGRAEQEARRVLRPLPELGVAGAGMWRTQARMVWRAGLLLPAVEFAVLVAAGFGVVAGRLTAGQVLAALGYAALGMAVVGQATALTALQRARASAARLTEVLEAGGARGGAAAVGVASGGAAASGAADGKTAASGTALGRTPAGVAAAAGTARGETAAGGESSARTAGGEAAASGTSAGEVVAGEAVPVATAGREAVAARAVGGEAVAEVAVGAVELRGVTAGVLRGVDLVVAPGSRVAVVGRSGAGKSALARVVAGLTAPESGRVLRGGAVACAFERPALLGETVGAAVAYGTAASPERVERACRAAQVHDVVVRLPLGYATPLADTPLSGGEAQRLGLARAVVRDPEVLVLDDATASLDTVTEATVESALETALPGRTRIVVTHRAATAARADSVVWLEGGRVRGTGDHGRLWRDPAYRAVFG
ncbi:ABC transporter ATP-binding protein [Actinosynnema pretiosum subsp. pretiosum]|uniref:ABC transporter ATP-binding protein n=1 Tax=Actinosynnema pretiosum subsp. pretiosum TaxID=103721 RepID=A0AA45LBW0_9PSEU|nr:Putative ABC iron siderophore transporter, fused permease and ATPase domains [Actinosynnema pretiosum subsp. pretiosum]QUF07031.1 ABC transporter ATP-binding protein [Actinosynnema pretiosum subsp. pretiosum]